jgi:lipoprotein-anchoring transpeptidase ErfK/SrfK
MSRIRTLAVVAVFGAASATTAGCGAGQSHVTATVAPANTPMPTPTPSASAVVTSVAPIVVAAKVPKPSSAIALVASAPGGVTIYRRPGGRVLRHLSARTDLGAVRTLLVTQHRDDGWLQVLLPIRPNNTFGWIRPHAVTVTPTSLRVEISRAHRTLTLLQAGKPVVQYPVAVGAPATPTPTGLFSITDRLPTLAPYGPFGPYAFGLSGYSNVLTSFDGGDGVIGIHGTNADWSVGHAVSHGCVRLHNRDIARLYKLVPLGTPVLVI